MDKDLFEEGYQHGLKSNKLINFKESFREGFRKAKLELREMRRQQGIVPFPGTSEGSIKVTSKH